MPNTISINRAPVLTLWAAVVAERLGFDRATALTLGQAAAGRPQCLCQGRSLGIIEPKPDLVRDQVSSWPRASSFTSTCELQVEAARS
jgi:hypothetical protein